MSALRRRCHFSFMVKIPTRISQTGRVKVRGSKCSRTSSSKRITLGIVCFNRYMNKMYQGEKSCYVISTNLGIKKALNNIQSFFYLPDLIGRERRCKNYSSGCLVGFAFANFANFLLNLSIRPAVSTNFILPVKNG